jgi:Undecaprenyl-phosphate glucose phosphotransferase
MAFGSDIQDEPSRIVTVSKKSARTIPPEAVPLALITLDVLIIVLSCAGTGIVYGWWIGDPRSNIFAYCGVGLLASLIHTLRMSGDGYYEYAGGAKPRVEVTEIAISWFTTGLLLAFLAFILKIGVSYSRGAFILFCCVAPVGLLAGRKLTKVVLRSVAAHGAIGHRDVVLLGDFNELSALQPHDLLAISGAAQVNQFALSREEDRSVRVSDDIRTIKSVANFVRARDCREVLLALPWNDEERLELIREHLRKLPVAARLLPDMRVRALTNYSSSVRQRVLSIEIQRPPFSLEERGIKRATDLVIGSLALIFLSPIMALTAIAIKLDGRGPVLFRQHRKGFNGKQFVMLKFRTMTVQEDGPIVPQATPGDPRVTPIGRLLRASSIDELPQLLNVMKGDMSLIGPRPHALAHDSHFESILRDYAFRHHVKPGMTGWAQCNGARGATPSIDHIAERVKLDLWYINNWSLWLDIQILMKTFIEVLRKRNAY